MDICHYTLRYPLSQDFNICVETEDVTGPDTYTFDIESFIDVKCNEAAVAPTILIPTGDTKKIIGFSAKVLGEYFTSPAGNLQTLFECTGKINAINIKKTTRSGKIRSDTKRGGIAANGHARELQDETYVAPFSVGVSIEPDGGTVSGGAILDSSTLVYLSAFGAVAALV